MPQPQQAQGQQHKGRRSNQRLPKAEFNLFFGNLAGSTQASGEAQIRLENTSLQRPLLGIRLEHARSQIRLLTGDIEGCEQRLSASLKEIERLGYSKRPVQGWLLAVMSDMVSISGNTSAALEFDRKALAAFENAFGTDSFAYGFALGGQSELVDESGDAAAGEMILDRGRIILGHFVSPSHLLFYHSNFAKAGFLEDRGRSDEAITLLASDLGKVIEHAGINNMMVAHAYSRLGLLQEESAPLEAEAAYRKMLPIYAQIVGTNNAMYGYALCTVGSFLLGQKRTDEGLAILEAGVEKVRTSVGANPATFQKAFRLGYEQLSIPNRSDRGLRLMRESLAGLLRTAGPSDPWAVLFEWQLSLAEAAAGNWSNALSLLSLSLQNQRRQLLEMSLWLSDTEALEDQRMQGWTLLNGFLDSMVLQVPTNEIPNVVSVAATHVAEGKAILEECYKLRHALDQQGETVRTLRKCLGVIDRQLEESQQERFDPKAWPAKQLLDERSRLEQDLAGKSQAVKQAMTGTPATHERLVRALPKDAALIDFVLWRSLPLRTNEPARDQYAAYVTLAGPTTLGRSQVVRVDLGPADPIDSLCDQVHVAIAGGRISEQRLRPILDRLSALLVGPLAKVVNLHSHWIVSPVGQLSRVPFEALRDSNTGRHLIEDKRISYVSSGREVVRLAEPKASVPTNAPVVMGFPDFDLPLAATARELAGPPVRPDYAAAFVAARTPATLSRDARGQHFNPLPDTEREARSAAKLLGEDCVLRLGADAREAELKRVVSPRILHLATHGFYLTDQEFRATNSLPDLLAGSFGPRFGRRNANEDWENPLIRCGIALAGANHAGGLTNAAAEDGILTGLEAALLNLQGTELVILSACQTGAGDVRIGEGVMSLRRAFTIAGAQSVLASHWRVSDEATSRLITEFLRHWRAGKPRVEALREAQLSLLRSREFSSPFYWAAFTLTGQWR